MSDLIDKIIAKQMADNQFLNSDITFREIESNQKSIKKEVDEYLPLKVRVSRIKKSNKKIKKSC